MCRQTSGSAIVAERGLVKFCAAAPIIPGEGTVLQVSQLTPRMVRLFYKCPETGVIIVGGQMSEDTVMRAYDFPAAVQCPACEEIHHPKVRECQMVRSALPRYAAPRLVT